MPVENAGFVSQLNETYPLPRDRGAQGDDHLRLVKSAIKNTFPQFSNQVNMSSSALNILNNMWSTVDGSSLSIRLDTGNGVFASQLTMDPNTTIISTELRVSDGLRSATNLTPDASGNKDVVTNFEYNEGRYLKRPIGDTPTSESSYTIDEIERMMQERVWPIGCIYSTSTNEDPTTTFGFGSWERIGAGRCIVDQGTLTQTSPLPDRTYSAGATGGNADHVQALSQMPYHKHDFTGDDKLQSNTGGYFDLISKNQWDTTAEGGDGARSPIVVTNKIYDANNAVVKNDDTATTPMYIQNPFYVAYMWRRTA